MQRSVPKYLAKNAQYIQEGKSGAYQMLSSVASIINSTFHPQLVIWSIKTLWKKVTEINFHEQNKVLKDLAVLQLSLFRSRDLFDLGLYNGQGVCTRTNKH